MCSQEGVLDLEMRNKRSLIWAGLSFSSFLLFWPLPAWDPSISCFTMGHQIS